MTDNSPRSAQTEATPIDLDQADADCECPDVEVDCNAALRELYEYLDGEITEARCESIRLHIDGCGHCLEAFGFEVELRELVARTCRCEAPDTLRARVAQALADCEANGFGDAPAR